MCVTMGHWITRVTVTVFSAGVAALSSLLDRYKGMQKFLIAIE